MAGRSPFSYTVWDCLPFLHVNITLIFSPSLNNKTYLSHCIGWIYFIQSLTKSHEICCKHWHWYYYKTNTNWKKFKKLNCGKSLVKVCYWVCEWDVLGNSLCPKQSSVFHGVLNIVISWTLNWYNNGQCKRRQEHYWYIISSTNDALCDSHSVIDM